MPPVFPRSPRPKRSRSSRGPGAGPRRRRHPAGGGPPPRAAAGPRTGGMTMATFGARAEPLAPYTSLRIGGPADFFLRVAAEKDLLASIQVARENELPVFVLGGGTHPLVADRRGRGGGLQKAWRGVSADRAHV